jgi:hypothetical protein
MKGPANARHCITHRNGGINRRRHFKHAHTMLMDGRGQPSVPSSVPAQSHAIPLIMLGVDVNSN